MKKTLYLLNNKYINYNNLGNMLPLFLIKNNILCSSDSVKIYFSFFEAKYLVNKLGANFYIRHINSNRKFNYIIEKT